MDYEIFNLPPDFSAPPARSVARGTDSLAISPAPSVIAWPDTMDNIVTRWKFTGRVDSERNYFMGFFERIGGRNGCFLMPTWQRDFSCVALPSEGETVVAVNITGYAATYFADTYPDRPGKYVYFYCPANGFHGSRVIRAVDDGAASLITLEDAIPFNAQPGTICGWLLTSRFEMDQLERECLNETHWRCDMPIRNIRVTHDVTRTVLLEAMAGHLVWKAPTSAEQTLKPAARILYNYAFAQGPVTLSTVGPVLSTAAPDTPNPARMASTWAAWCGSDGVYIAKRSTLDPFTITDADGVKSTLFSKKVTTPHLSFAFDENGDEVIAFARKNETLISVVGRVSGVVTQFDFEGFSPQLFQFWTINNEAYDREDADIVCIYVKRGTAAIYGRFESESFDTEHLIGSCPNVPLRIEYVEMSGTDMRIVCIDDGHREMILHSDYSYTTHGYSYITHHTFEPLYTDTEVETIELINHTFATYGTMQTLVEYPVGTDGSGHTVFGNTLVDTLGTFATNSIEALTHTTHQLTEIGQSSFDSIETITHTTHE